MEERPHRLSLLRDVGEADATGLDDECAEETHSLMPVVNEEVSELERQGERKAKQTRRCGCEGEGREGQRTRREGAENSAELTSGRQQHQECR